METQDMSTYERILSAAAKLFAAKGYDGTTTREIVKEANSSLSSLQFHFQSKEAIYLEAVERALTRQHLLLKPELDTIDELERQGRLHGDSVWDLIVDLVGKMSDWVFLQEENDTILLMNREMLDRSPLMGSVPEVALAIHRGFQKLFEAYVGVEDSFWAKTLSFSVVMSMFDFANYPRVLGQVLECDVTTGENARQIKMLMKDYLLTSLRAYLNERRMDFGSSL